MASDVLRIAVWPPNSSARPDSAQKSESDAGGSFFSDLDDEETDAGFTTSNGLGSVSQTATNSLQKTRHCIEDHEVLQQIENENVTGVLRRLDSIRQLAGDAQVLRRKENREQNTRGLHIAHTYSLLLEEAEFNPQNVQQRNFLGILEGIMLQNAEIFFFSVDDVRKKMATGPSVKLKDAISRPYRYSERLVIDTELLERMLNELQTDQILEILNKTREYLTFKQTTYQVKSIEDRDSQVIMNATGMAVYQKWLFIADATGHCIWRLTASRFEASGAVRTSVEKPELYAGSVKVGGFTDGQRHDARFRTPMGIVVAESVDKMFVVDTDNSAIRQMDLITDLVTTIRIEPELFSSEFLQASFIQPKGICVIKGEKVMLNEMERCQEAKYAEFNQAQAKAAKKRNHTASLTTSSTSSSTSSDSTGSGSGSCSSGSGSGSGSEGDSSGSTSTASSSEGSAESSTSDSAEGAKNSRTSPTIGIAMPASPTHSSSINPPSGFETFPHRYDDQLDIGRSTRYSVLQAKEPDQLSAPRRPEGSAVVWNNAASIHNHGMLSNPNPVRSLLASRRNSYFETVDEEQLDDPIQNIRLAVTCDHCIWFINPVTGRARVIAGNPTQYGYCDSQFGLDCRFSSPKGILNIRSVLFVCDYWNNVLRCVNLYTTQVDTVVDFCPQGPSAISMSNSGVLYVLDSDVVHYTNILQIMSAQANPDGSSSAMPDDRWYYSNMFSRPQTRSTSSMSDRTTLTQRGPEIYDVNTTHSKRIVQPGFQAAVVAAPVPAPSDNSQTFSSRLEAHLREAAQAKDFADKRLEEKREVDKHRGRKRRRQKTHKKKRKKIQTIHDQRRSVHNPPATPPGNAGSDDDDSDGSPCKSPNSPKSPSFHLTVNAPQSGPNSGRNSDAGSRSSQRRKGRSQNDYVEQTKIILSTLGTMGDSSDAPKTLADLGVGSRRGSFVGTNLWGGQRQTVSLDNEAPVIRNGGGQTEKAASSDCAGAGTVIVHGGRVFIRSVADAAMPASAWTEMRQEDSSRVASRVASRRESTRRESSSFPMIEIVAPFVTDNSRNQQDGVDEDGYAVTFNDLTIRGQSTSPLSDEFSGLRSLDEQEGDAGVSSSSQNLQGRRHSSLKNGLSALESFVGLKNDSASIPSIVDSRRASNMLLADKSASNSRRASMIDSRRASYNAQMLRDASKRMSLSINGTSISGTKTENSALEQPRRRSSFLAALIPDSTENEKRRSLIISETQAYLTGGSSNSRRQSLTTGEDDMDGSGQRRVSIKRVSISEPNRTHPGDSSNYLNPAEKRLSYVGSRRSSVVVNIMPTVLDHDEDDNESDHDSQKHSDHNSEQDSRQGSSGEGQGSSDRESPADRDEEATHTSDASDEDAGDDAASSHTGGSPNSDGGNGAESAGAWGPSKSQVSSQDGSAGKKQPNMGSRCTPSTQTGAAAQSPEPFLQTQSPAPPHSKSDRRSNSISTGGGASIRASANSSGTTSYVSLAQMPFTRNIDVDAIQKTQQYRIGSTQFGSQDCLSDESRGLNSEDSILVNQSTMGPGMDFNTLAQLPTITQFQSAESSNSRRTSTALTAIVGGKSRRGSSKTWRTLALPELLSFARRTFRKYPNTPLALTWFENADESFLFVGLLSFPTVLKILTPKYNEPDKHGRFNVLPIDSNRVLLADEKCHQIWLLNHQTKTKRHLAGCGKCGYHDGPLGICRFNSPCSMTLDPRSHCIYVADRGNHMIRKIDLLSGLVSTVVGSGSCGNRDGSNIRRQALDSPFEVSFAEPHYLMISCADNSIRSFNLLTNSLDTILVGS